ncbi:MAG: type II secretion system protein [Actinomycetota bacterium]|nr:type II secretion system protein [Actinomycetota bacterium]
MLSSLVDRLNDRRRADEEVGEDAGFTLIELMVVLLIMAILLAIAIPTFLGVTGSANDRAAQSNLNTALTSAKGVYESNQQTYPAVATLVSDIAKDEPSLTVQADSGSQLAAGDIGVYVTSGGNGALLYSLAKKTNECWWVADNTQAIANGGTTAAPSAPYVVPASPLGKTSTGVPNTAGDYYGVFNTTTGKPGATAEACDEAGIAKATSSVLTAGFPSAP